jgi:DNA mismatch repair ATPase MutS
VVRLRHQVGKFYEIFHMDADIATKELDVIYMKVRGLSMKTQKYHTQLTA